MSLIPQPVGDGWRDRYGIDQISAAVKIPVDQVASALQAVGAAHPNFPRMAIDRATYRFTDGGAFALVTYVYAGVLSRLPEPTFELNGALSQEPIQTHPDFATLAGTPQAPANGAIFDEDGAFATFGPGPLAGATSYLAPGAEWSRISFSFQRPNLNNLGKIGSPPGNPPTLAGHDWLVGPPNAMKRGGVWQLREPWILSGPNGWSPLVYS